MREDRALLVVGAITLTLGLGWAGMGFGDYGARRAAWERESDRVGEPGYDAERSDALYLEVERAAQDVANGTLLAVAGAVALGLALAGRRARPRTPVEPASLGRSLAASILDLVVFVAILTLGSLFEAARDPDALRAAVAAATPALGFAALVVPLAAGQTPGMAMVGVDARRPDGAPPPRLSAVLVGALAPVAGALALAAAPLLAVPAFRNRALVAPHVQLGGLVVARRP